MSRAITSAKPTIIDERQPIRIAEATWLREDQAALRGAADELGMRLIVVHVDGSETECVPWPSE
jgi:hypothetical protein